MSALWALFLHLHTKRIVQKRVRSCFTNDIRLKKHTDCKHLLALATLSLTPGVAPLRAYSHYHVRVFGMFPWARPRFWTWLAVGYAVVVAAVAQRSHAAGGAWPGLIEESESDKHEECKSDERPRPGPTCSVAVLCHGRNNNSIPYSEPCPKSRPRPWEQAKNADMVMGIGPQRSHTRS